MLASRDDIMFRLFFYEPRLDFAFSARPILHPFPTESAPNISDAARSNFLLPVNPRTISHVSAFHRNLSFVRVFSNFKNVTIDFAKTMHIHFLPTFCSDVRGMPWARHWRPRTWEKEAFCCRKHFCVG